MRIKEGFITRKINDFYAVVPINKKVLDFSGMMTLNASGKVLFDLLSNDISVDELIAQMRDLYDVSQEQAKKDIELFIKKLEDHDLLIK